MVFQRLCVVKSVSGYYVSGWCAHTANSLATAAASVCYQGSCCIRVSYIHPGTIQIAEIAYTESWNKKNGLELHGHQKKFITHI